MRTIKFRGISKDTNKFAYGDHLYDKVEDKHFIATYDKTFIWREEVYPETVGQYIRFTDSNGQDVYEGDIVKDYKGHKYMIEYWNTGFSATLLPDQATRISAVDLSWCCRVGTIHDGKYPKLDPEAEHKLKVLLTNIAYQRDILSEIKNDFHIQKLEGLNNVLDDVVEKISEVVKGK